MPATANQLRANRLNAKKSTGPRTPEGKARSSQNGLTHGLYAQSPLALSIEDQEQAEQLRTALLDEHQPANPTEEFLLRQLTQAAVRLQRLDTIEHGHWEAELQASLHRQNQRHPDSTPLTMEDLQQWSDISKATLLATLACNEADTQGGGTDFFSKLTRQRSAAERSFYKSLQALEKAKATRPKQELQTEPNYPQTGEGEPTAPGPLTLVPAATKTTAETKPQSEPNTPQTRETVSSGPAILEDAPPADQPSKTQGGLPGGDQADLAPTAPRRSE